MKKLWKKLFGKRYTVKRYMIKRGDLFAKGCLGCKNPHDPIFRTYRTAAAAKSAATTYGMAGTKIVPVRVTIQEI